MRRLTEARAILTAFGFDEKQTNDLAGKTLLALARMKKSTPWAEASNERCRISTIYNWIETELGFAKPDREQVRRQVMHQFVDAGFCFYNDDDPSRPPNDQRTNYRLTEDVLAIIRQYGTQAFDSEIAGYLAKAPGLAAKYAAARDLTRIPVTLPGGIALTLKAGGQNVLIKAMIDDFCGYFIPGGEVIYIGDADSKLLHFDEALLSSLGVTVDTHGKLPDLVVYQPTTNWLFLMEAASSHGPVDAKRHGELTRLFAGSKAGLIYVSCFPDRATMRKFLADLAWETEAWCASDPTHMIHLNGDKFLGPYI
ncbi:BsuBI/PstI family type II restriction endonuclease [Agromyces sp. SYSU T00194]|uniref:BsuBI/PstI family type II restriction endonuclease n=1 Tax=Agromyces chitinivorans TaxID=3158560 RepID=UPI003391D86B